MKSVVDGFGRRTDPRSGDVHELNLEVTGVLAMAALGSFRWRRGDRDPDGVRQIAEPLAGMLAILGEDVRCRDVLNRSAAVPAG